MLPTAEHIVVNYTVAEIGPYSIFGLRLYPPLQSDQIAASSFSKSVQSEQSEPTAITSTAAFHPNTRGIFSFGVSLGDSFLF
jgi:hypothetical protein